MNDPRPHQHLADRLSAEAASLSIADTPVEVVVARGRQRQHRRRTAVGLAAVVAIAGTAIGSVAVLTRPAAPDAIGSDDTGSPDTGASDTTVPPVSDGSVVTPTTTVDGAPVTVDTAVPPVTKVPSNMVWNVVEPNSAEALGMTFGPAVGDGPYLAWSTQPATVGSNQPNVPTLWRSDDAVSWQQVDSAPPVSGLSPMLAAQGNRFLTFGTAVAASGDVEARFASSDDGAASWSSVALPLGIDTLRADPTVRTVGVNPSSIVASDTAVVLAVSVNPVIDVERLLGSKVVLPYNFTEAGIEVFGTCSTDGFIYDTVAPTTVLGPALENGAATMGTVTAPSACDESLVGLHPWDELGVAPATVEALFRNSHLLVSTDGTSFTEVDLPLPETGATLGQSQLATYADGFALAATWYQFGTGEQWSTMYVSADGQAWREVATPRIVNITSLTGFGDRLVVVGFSDVNGMIPAVAVGIPDGGWTVTGLTGLLGPDDGVKPWLGVGPQVVADGTGITITGWVSRDLIAEVGGVDIVRGSVTMRADDQNGYRFLDTATGVELGSYVNGVPTGAVAQAENGLTVQPADGEAAAFSWDDLAVVYTQALEQLGIDPVVGVMPEGVVMHSVDGASWSIERGDDLAGTDVGFSGWLRGTGSQVIVAMLRPPATPGGVPQQVLLVGTPKG
jgi:hypothetical protein